jgi:large conductance mechanosensitive channel
MFKEFRDFAMKGNVLDLAIGVIIGAAFGKIISSFVSDVLMPPIGVLLGKVDFSEIYINLSGGSYPSLAEAKKAGAATINIGLFANQVIDFVIVAFCVFLVVKAVNSMKRVEAIAAATKDCEFCKMPIPVAALRCGHCTSQLKAI